MKNDTKSESSWKSFVENCNLVDNQYQQKSEVLCSFTLNKSYAYLLNVEPKTLVFLKTWNTGFGKIIITFMDQNGRPLEHCILINRNATIFYRAKN